MGSILDFAPKHEQQIAVYEQRIAVYGVTFALVVAFVGVSVRHNPVVEDLGEVWACAKAARAPHWSHSGNLVADFAADIAATIEAARELKDEASSCKKLVERADKVIEMARKATPELRLLEKEAPKLYPAGKEVAKLLGELADHAPQAASEVLEHAPQAAKVFGVFAR